MDCELPDVDVALWGQLRNASFDDFCCDMDGQDFVERSYEESVDAHGNRRAHRVYELRSRSNPLPSWLRMVMKNEPSIFLVEQQWWIDAHDRDHPMTNHLRVLSPRMLIDRVECIGSQWVEPRPAGGVIVRSHMEFTVTLQGLGGAIAMLLAVRAKSQLKSMAEYIRKYLALHGGKPSPARPPPHPVAPLRVATSPARAASLPSAATRPLPPRAGATPPPAAAAHTAAPTAQAPVPGVGPADDLLASEVDYASPAMAARRPAEPVTIPAEPAPILAGDPAADPAPARGGGPPSVAYAAAQGRARTASERPPVADAAQEYAPPLDASSAAEHAAEDARLEAMVAPLVEQWIALSKTTTEVVEHLHCPADEFDRLDGLLRPGGLLAVMTSFQTNDAEFGKWHYRRDPTHVVFFREETFRLVAERRGWTCEFPAKDVALMRKPVETGATVSVETGATMFVT